MEPNQFSLDFRKDNSRIARVKSQPKAGSDGERIVRFLRLKQIPMSARGISQNIDIDYHAIQRRMSELVSAGLVVICGKDENNVTIYKAHELESH